MAGCKAFGRLSLIAHTIPLCWTGQHVNMKFLCWKHLWTPVSIERRSVWGQRIPFTCCMNTTPLLGEDRPRLPDARRSMQVTRCNKQRSTRQVRSFSALWMGMWYVEGNVTSVASVKRKEKKEKRSELQLYNSEPYAALQSSSARRFGSSYRVSVGAS